MSLVLHYNIYTVVGVDMFYRHSLWWVQTCFIITKIELQEAESIPGQHMENFWPFSLL